MNKGLRGGLALSLALLLGGCGISNGTVLAPVPEPTTGGGGGAAATNPDYTGTIQAILSSSCTSCHSGATPPAGVNLSTYDGVLKVISPGDAAGSLLFQEVDSGGMPLGGPKLAQATIDTIKTWIDGGAVESNP